MQMNGKKEDRFGRKEEKYLPFGNSNYYLKTKKLRLEWTSPYNNTCTYFYDWYLRNFCDNKRYEFLLL